VWHFVTKCTGMKLAKPRVSSHFSELTDPSYVSSSMCPGYPAIKFGRPGYSLHPLESGPEFVQGPDAMTTSPTLLCPIPVWSQQNYLRLQLIVRYFESSYGCCPRDSPQRKTGHKNERMNEWARKPTLNLSIYEIVFSLFAKS